MVVNAGSDPNGVLGARNGLGGCVGRKHTALPVKVHGAGDGLRGEGNEFERTLQKVILKRGLVDLVDDAGFV